MNSYVLLVLDSCRYDSMLAAWPHLLHIPKLGSLRRAYSLSTWTLTSHILFTMGRLPWIEDRSDFHRQKTSTTDLRLWKSRLGLFNDHPFADESDFRSGLARLGYQMNAITSANPLTENSIFQSFVDNLESVGRDENCLERALTKIDSHALQYLIINVCETHYPYFDGDHDPVLASYRLPGYGAQIRAAREDRVAQIPLYTAALLSLLRKRQIDAIRYIDSIMPKLLRVLPPTTYLTITSDHGDCFGEDGFVGHGEVWNKFVLEVPFVEGRVLREYV
jgi:hypothetical protein